MKRKGKRLLSWVLTLTLMLSLLPSMSLTAYAAPTETLLTTITATGQEQANYSTANVATVSFSYTAYGSSAYLANWGWWGYGWIATVTPADGYTITKCVFYDDANRTATDREAPFVVETTEEDKTPKVNGNPILANTSKGIKKIEVYGYATPAHTHDFTYSASGATITATCSADGCDLDDGTEQHNHTATLTIAAEGGTYDGTTAYSATVTNNIPAVTGDTVGDVAYYKVDTQGATTGGTVQTGAPTGAGYYYASVTLTSGSNTYTAVKAFTVAKIDPTAPTGLTATYGQKLSDVVLPTGWTWADSTQSVGNVVSPAATFKANFAGDDNYNAASNVDVTVTVSKADHTAPTGLTATYGQTLANVTLPDGWTWADSTQSVGNVVDPAATFKANFAGDDNHNAASNVDVTVTVGKATPTLTNISAGAITYGQALSASTVSGTATGVNNEEVTGTWAWTTDTTKPAVSNSDATQYDVTFTSSDSNYNNATGKASLTVNPKEVGLDWSNTSFTYDKQSHSPTASASNLEAADEGKVSVTVTGGQTNAGEHTATASELSGDSAANYTLPAANTTTFTIAKKEVGLNWANTSFTYDGQAHAPTASATGVESGDTCTVTVTGEQTNAGENYTATATSLSNSNYKLPSNATQSFTITPKAITATADNKSTSYKNNLAALTFTLSDGALVQGDSEDSLKITASTDAKKDSPKGTYPITLAKGQDSNPNYDVTLNDGTYTISEADATITASAYNGTYDGQEHSITVTVKDEAHNIVDLVKQLFGQNNTPEATVYYSTVSVEDALNQKNTTAPTRKEVGETTVYYAVEFGGNYKAEPVTGSQTVAITRKDLTITANNQNVAYNGSFATGTDLVTCDTLVGNDELTEITLTLTNDNTIVPSDAKIMQNGEDKTQNYNISYANGTFSKSAAPAPAPAPTPTTETITIPVSGEGKDAKTTAVTVEVKNNTATVTSADIGDVLDAKDVGTVTVNVDSLPNTVDEVVLPTELVEKVAKAVADKDNDASGLEIKLPTGTVTFDAKTVAAIADKANGKDVTLHLDTVSESSLTSGQQSTVKELNALVVLDAYVTADGKRISDFNGGKATFSVPVELKDGQVPEGVAAFFVDDNGDMTEIPCSCDGKTATGTVEHFSNYVITYDESRVTKPEPQPEPEPEPTPGPATPTDIGYDDLSEAEKKQAEEIASALGVDKDTAAQMVKTAQELGVSMDTVKLSGDALAKLDVDSSDPKGTDFGKLTARVTKRTNSALTLKWTKQKNADGYLIYGNKCGKGNKMKLLKTIKKNGTVSYTQKKLKKGTYYKYMVVAYKNVNGKKMPIAASVVIHVPTKGGKTTVAKSLTVKQGKKVVSKLTVKKGKSVTIKVTENKEEKKLKVKTHRAVKFESSNPKIAKVNAKGKITGKKKGKATVWAYTQNGIFKAIQVTVK